MKGRASVNPTEPETETERVREQQMQPSSFCSASVSPSTGTPRSLCCGGSPAGDGFAQQLRFAFVYGTLKRNFGNHWLMQELMAQGHASFVGSAHTSVRFPLVCGPFQVPFLLHFPSSGHHVVGELYQVDNAAIERLDELEGVSKGHYERRPVTVLVRGSQQMGMHSSISPCSHHDYLTSSEALSGSYEDVKDGLVGDCGDEDHEDMSMSMSSNLLAEAYFAASDYSPHMADRAPHIPCYTEHEASTYIRRKDRPQNRTFLEHVYAWIDKQKELKVLSSC